MWLHLPSSACSAVLDSSTPQSESLYLDLAQSATWRGKSLQPQSWQRVCKTALSMKLLSGATLPPSTVAHGMALWMESLADSRARISVSQAGKLESPEQEAGCGPSICESFAKFNPDGSLSKTSLQCSLFQQEEPYLEGLPRSGSMRNGELYERSMSVPRTEEIERSSWRTPNTRDHHAGGPRLGHDQRQVALVDQIANWPTPHSEDSESCGNHPGAVDSLTGAARLWPTPCEDNANNTGGPSRPRGAMSGGYQDLTVSAALWTTPQAHDQAGGSAERVGMFGTKHGGSNLADDVTLWQTPATDSFRSRGGDRKNEMGLDQQARRSELARPTPKSRDFRSAEGDAGMMRQSPDLNVIAYHFSHQDQEIPKPGGESSPTTQASRRRLNPNFVDWMMALPGWTVCAPLETGSWYSRLRMRLDFLLGVPGS